MHALAMLQLSKGSMDEAALLVDAEWQQLRLISWPALRPCVEEDPDVAE